MAEELLLYTSEGLFSIYPANIYPPGIPVTFGDQPEAEAFLRRIIEDVAVRHTLFLICNYYVGKAPLNLPDEQIIKGLAQKLAGGELMVTQRLAGRPAGKDAIERRKKEKPEDKPEATPAKQTEQKKRNRTIDIAPAPKKELKKDCKIVIEVAGTRLDDCCADKLVSAAVGPRLKRLDAKRTTPMANAGKDDHRHEVELKSITADNRAIYINPGCSEADDAACLIPLHKKAWPVDEKAESNQWPTALVPLVPLAFTDADNTPDQAMALRNGWLYIYLNGRIWRELHASGDNTFRDVNFGLPKVAGADVREPSGHAVTTILVPHTIEGETQTVQIAFAEVQWTWRQVCALGGPADEDPRFLPKVIADARAIPVDQARRGKRFYTLDLSAYPGPFKGADHRILPIEEAPLPKKGEKDPFARLRDKKIAAVILEDPLLVARRLAAEHQQAWRDMQELLETLAKAPQTAIKEKTYNPGRWFEAAVLANQFFFAPFPDYESWQKLHPGADEKAWRQTRARREKMQAGLDKEAIDEALGVRQREQLRPGIDATRRKLVDYLSARTSDELDLLVLMLDDYFSLPWTTGKENTPGQNPHGYVDGWSVIEQLIARLGDHSQTLNADLFADPPDTARLTRENPGTAFLNTIADPDQNHVLYTRLFPKPAGDLLTPDTTPGEDHAPGFKPQRFADKNQPGTEPVADFARHYARAAPACDHPRVRQSIIRLANAVFDLQLAQQEVTFEELEQHGALNALPPDQNRELFTSLIKGAPTGPQLAAFFRRLSLFFKQSADDAMEEAATAPATSTVQADIYSLQKLNPKKHYILDAENLHDWDIRMIPGKSVRVKNPLIKPENAYVIFPGGLTTTIKVVNRKGKIIGGMSLNAFRQGDFDPRKFKKWVEKHKNAKWLKTRVTLVVSKIPDIAARIGRLVAEKRVVSRVFIPLAVMFETWNVSQAGKTWYEKWNSDDAFGAGVDFLGAVVDFAALSAAIKFAGIEHKGGKPWPELVKKGSPWATKVKIIGSARGFLGVAAGICSSYQSGRDMLTNLRQNDDAAAAHGVMLTGFALYTIYETAWACNFISVALLQKGTLAWAMGITGGPLLWISLGVVLAGAALLVFMLREDTPLEEWLANGPFSVRTFTPNLVAVYDETAAGGDLIVDENNCLAGVVPSVQGRLVEKEGTVFQVDADGKPIQTIGEIGRPIKAPPTLKDSSHRFAHHRPGDTDLGPPPGASSTMKKYTATARVMEFWQEADKSHLWITREGILHDYAIREEPGADSRLFLHKGAVYLKSGDGQVRLGRKGDPIQNRDRLLKDRKDNPRDKSNKFRNWCEKPAGAYHALAAALFTPRVRTGFSATPRPDVQYPNADPFKGYDYQAHIHVSLPHFIAGRSRLLVQLWQAGVEKVPHLIYDERIAVHVDDDQPLRRMSIAWPLKKGCDRKLDLTIRVKLDLYGDGKLCLPLDPDTGEQTWMTETRRVDKLELRYDQDPLAVLMEVGM